MEFEAIILAAYPYHEADLVLRALSIDRGKMSLLARRARSRKSGLHIDVFDHARLLVKPGKGGLTVLNSHIPLQSFGPLRDSLDRLNCASIVCECFDFIIQESSSCSHDTELFELLKLCLSALSESNSLKQMLRSVYITLLRLLELSGYLDTSNQLEPGSKALALLIAEIEHIGGRKLRSQPALQMSIQSMRQSQVQS